MTVIKTSNWITLIISPLVCECVHGCIFVFLGFRGTTTAFVHMNTCMSFPLSMWKHIQLFTLHTSGIVRAGIESATWGQLCNCFVYMCETDIHPVRSKSNTEGAKSPVPIIQAFQHVEM